MVRSRRFDILSRRDINKETFVEPWPEAGLGVRRAARGLLHRVLPLLPWVFRPGSGRQAALRLGEEQEEAPREGVPGPGGLLDLHQGREEQ